MNQNFQKEKNLVLDYYKALDKAEGDEISKVFWQPFRHAFKNM